MLIHGLEPETSLLLSLARTLPVIRPWDLRHFKENSVMLLAHTVLRHCKSHFGCGPMFNF
jgi:hypothetical protein